MVVRTNTMRHRIFEKLSKHPDEFLFPHQIADATDNIISVESRLYAMRAKGEVLVDYRKDANSTDSDKQYPCYKLAKTKTYRRGVSLGPDFGG